MIVVCPNCHVLPDFKAIEIDKAKLKIKEPHKVEETILTIITETELSSVQQWVWRTGWQDVVLPQQQ